MFLCSISLACAYVLVGAAQVCNIVQFVPFRDFKNKTPQAFSTELLAEIPHQLLSFMKMKGLKPRPRVQVVQPQAVPVVAQAQVAAVAVPGAVKVDVK